MKKQIALGLAALALAGITAGAALADGGDEGPSSQVPVPGFEGVDETIVVNEVPVPGFEGVDETIVVNGMPVPGFEGLDETIVESAG